jgi:2-C-methyl-D-erythritol 2,4-cyclodiphosphate synthase
MRTRLAGLLGTDVDAINIKGKTHEKVDAVGEGRAIEVHVVALLIP